MGKSIHYPCPFGNDGCPLCNHNNPSSVNLNKPMQNNNWIETMKTIGKISSIHPEIVDEFILITKELLTKKDQEHKAELESIKEEVQKLLETLPELESDEYDAGLLDMKHLALSILDSHINKL